MGNIEETKHFLDVEIDGSRRCYLEYGNVYDGVMVGYPQRQKLLQSHILFCEQIKKILVDGD